MTIYAYSQVAVSLSCTSTMTTQDTESRSAFYCFCSFCTITHRESARVRHSIFIPSLWISPSVSHRDYRRTTPADGTLSKLTRHRGAKIYLDKYESNEPKLNILERTPVRCISLNSRDGWVVVGTITFKKEAESGNLSVDPSTTLLKHSFVSSVTAEHLFSQTPEQTRRAQHCHAARHNRRIKNYIF